MPTARYVGLISGTSMDAIDAALIETDGQSLRLLAGHSHPWPPQLIAEIRDLARSAHGSLDALCRLDALAGESFAAAATELLRRASLAGADISAIGSHGQTVRHRPDADPAFTLQIGDANRIAERCGITTVADFRRRDLAAGGEGAPLVPAFHAAILGDANENRVVLNIGGIANITVLPAEQAPPRIAHGIMGFDTGPGNCLMDAWIAEHRQSAFDTDGAWAALGTSIPALLEELLSDPYFAQRAPKSTGTEYFGPEWLHARLGEHGDADPVDVQATLLRLTVDSIARAILEHAPGTDRVLVCGGGAHNKALMRQLAESLFAARVETTASCGLDPDWIEAMAFAWLAERTLHGKPGNLPSVTGASRPVVLGAIYPA